MSNIKSFFVTRIYQATLKEFGTAVDSEELEATCFSISEDDEAGQQWCEDNNFPGYTSYASLADLDWRFPIFKDLIKILNKHVAVFVKDLQFDLDGKKVKSGYFTVFHNGVLIHNHVEILGTTENVGPPKNIAHGDGPISLQNHCCSQVSFKNIWVRKLD